MIIELKIALFAFALLCTFTLGMVVGYVIRCEKKKGERNDVPSAEPETAKRIVGCARSGMTMWYQCDMCHEPVDEKDAFCRGCGRRFEDE